MVALKYRVPSSVWLPLGVAVMVKPMGGPATVAVDTVYLPLVQVAAQVQPSVLPMFRPPEPMVVV